ncbi:hypothetical protein [Legionella cardiaca]|uniref:Integrase n=1 Tax=Legionella cardiaca TaxID=1071983 RepID=A0ABY8ATX5_9GAMM|nr:hypothetical protein [Legionella cardiaca]WED42592.1 hypothetical protein PXX05_11830 [Legionella cardiaca]
MGKKDSQKEINQRYWEHQRDKQILKEFNEYVSEEKKLGHTETDVVPFHYTFSHAKTRNGLYRNLNQIELQSLIKKL